MIAANYNVGAYMWNDLGSTDRSLKGDLSLLTRSIMAFLSGGTM